MLHGQGDRSRRRGGEKGEKDVQIGLVSPGVLLDKSRQMEVFSRWVENQGPVVEMPLNMAGNL